MSLCRCGSIPIKHQEVQPPRHNDTTGPSNAMILAARFAAFMSVSPMTSLVGVGNARKTWAKLERRAAID